MNKKITITLALVVILTFIGGHWYKASLELSKKESPHTEEIESLRPERISDEEWKEKIASYRFLKKHSKLIHFYGKVIDQHEEPVTNAEVEICITGYSGTLKDFLEYGETRRLTVTTDANGLFELDDYRGTDLDVLSIKKKGFYNSREHGKTFYYRTYDYEDNHKPNKNQPVTYHLHKKGKTAPLIYFSKWLDIEPEEGITEVYFPFILNSKTSPKPIEGWDLKLTGQSKNKDNWEFTLTANGDGGFQLTKEEFANHAPEKGYKKSITFRSSNENAPRRFMTRTLYFRGDKGAKFAVFGLRVSISKRIPNKFSIKLNALKINPNGSRNLEYDEEKEIKE